MYLHSSLVSLLVNCSKKSIASSWRQPLKNFSWKLILSSHLTKKEYLAVGRHNSWSQRAAVTLPIDHQRFRDKTEVLSVDLTLLLSSACLPITPHHSSGTLCPRPFLLVAPIHTLSYKIFCSNILAEVLLAITILAKNPLLCTMHMH